MDVVVVESVVREELRDVGGAARLLTDAVG